MASSITLRSHAFEKSVITSFQQGSFSLNFDSSVAERHQLSLNWWFEG